MASSLELWGRWVGAGRCGSLPLIAVGKGQHMTAGRCLQKARWPKDGGGFVERWAGSRDSADHAVASAAVPYDAEKKIKGEDEVVTAGVCEGDESGDGGWECISRSDCDKTSAFLAPSVAHASPSPPSSFTFGPHGVANLSVPPPPPPPAKVATPSRIERLGESDDDSRSTSPSSSHSSLLPVGGERGG